MRQRGDPRTAWLFCAAAMAIAATGCGGPTTSSTATKQIVVGISSRTWTSPPLKNAGLQAQAEAKALGNVRVEFALTDDGPGQVTAVEGLIAKKVDVIAIDPNDDKAIIPAIKEANAAGIPVIMWVGGVTDGKVATTIVTSEQQGGKLIAEYVAKRLNQTGSVGLLQGQASHPAGRAREAGFREVLASDPNLKLTNYAEAGWVRDKGQAVAADFLTRTPNLDAMVALNDEMALGAVQSVADRGRSGKTLVTGYNGQCTALQSIWNGQLTATLYQPFGGMGRLIVQNAIKLKNGQSVPQTQTLDELAVDKAIMQQIADGSMKADEALKTDVANAKAGCQQ